MIGQNRQAAFQQAKADHDFSSSEQLLEENTALTRLVHQLSQQIHGAVVVEPEPPTSLGDAERPADRP